PRMKCSGLAATAIGTSDLRIPRSVRRRIRLVTDRSAVRATAPRITNSPNANRGAAMPSAASIPPVAAISTERLGLPIRGSTPAGEKVAASQSLIPLATGGYAARQRPSCSPAGGGGGGGGPA